MAERELRRIKSDHRAIIEEYQKRHPVKLGDLSKALGIASIKVSTMPTGVSGQISRENDGYVIKVNRNEARERQRFTIAHELAHFLLHKDVIDQSPDGITDNVLYRSGAPENVEYEANRLAAELIMPSAAVKIRVKEDYGNMVTEATIENLADKFAVSKAAMEIRLSSMN